MIRTILAAIALIAFTGIAAQKTVTEKIIKTDTIVTIKVDTIKTIVHDTLKITKTIKDTSFMVKVDTIVAKDKKSKK